jgi:hypothetical protein
MASGSQVWNGTWAAFAQAAIISMTKTRRRSGSGRRARAVNSNEPVLAKRISTATRKKAPPPWVISSALKPARRLRSSW